MRAFFAGLLVGLVTLSLLGRWTTTANQFQNFTRFHRDLNAETLFYPTASQVVALARSQATADQTLVVVGGSSVMYGSGQGWDELWTDRLRENLGDQYGVVNLAMPSGAPAEHGAVAAQALLREGRDVVFVTQVFPGFGGGGVLDGVRYRHVVWDAEALGLLYPLPARDALWDGVREELRIRAHLDRLLHFSDLWTTVAYHVGMPIWSNLHGRQRWFFDARSRFSEQAPPVLPLSTHYQPAHDADAMRSLEAEQRYLCPPDGQIYPALDQIVVSIQTHLPAELVARSVMVVLHRSPYYTDRLSDEGRACRREALRYVTEQLQAKGVTAVLVGEDWTVEDYTDLVHPSGAGGVKMATQLAPVIRELAARGNTR